MSTQTMTPVGTANIPVRRMDFEFDDAIPKYWFDNNPMLTMLLTGLSCVFPEGERMFMRAVRHYQDQITDPELQKEVRAFIGQEAHHGKEHQAFNDFMAKKDLPIARIEAFVKKAIAFEEKNLSKERMLAKTCALEHFTALLCPGNNTLRIQLFERRGRASISLDENKSMEVKNRIKNLVCM